MSEEKFDLFSFLNDISGPKTNLLKNTESPEFAEKIYEPYFVNRAFSMHIDTVMFAHEMNSRMTGAHALSKQMHHGYYLHSIPPAKRYGKWPRRDKDDLLKLVQEDLGCSGKKALQAVEVLGEDEVKGLLKNLYGGKK